MMATTLEKVIIIDVLYFDSVPMFMSNSLVPANVCA